MSSVRELTVFISSMLCLFIIYAALLSIKRVVAVSSRHIWFIFMSFHALDYLQVQCNSYISKTSLVEHVAVYLNKHNLVFIKQNMLNSDCKLKAPFPEPHFILQERIEHVALIKKKNLQSKSF